MRRIGFVLLSAGFAALAGLCCFAVGGRVGFVHGYDLAAHTGDVITANMAVTAMNASAEGDEEQAQALLELLVDNALVSVGSRQGAGWDRPVYAPAEYYLDLERHVGRLARHRKSHPRSLEHETADAMIQEVVSRYAGGAP